METIPSTSDSADKASCTAVPPPQDSGEPTGAGEISAESKETEECGRKRKISAIEKGNGARSVYPCVVRRGNPAMYHVQPQ